MPIATDIQIDVINRGIYRIASTIRNTIPEYSFGQSILLGGLGHSTSEIYIGYDVLTDRLMEPKQTVRGAEPNRRDMDDGFDENKVRSMYFADEMPVNLREAENRVPGEPLDANWSVNTRLAVIAARKRDAWLRGRNRKLEKVSWELLRTGGFSDYTGAVQSFDIDDGMLALDGSRTYTDLIGTLINACQKVTEHGGVVNRVIFNPTDWARIVTTDAFQKLADTRNYDGFRVSALAPQSPEERSANKGVMYSGAILVPGYGLVDVYTYNGFYTDDEGTTTYYLPQGQALVCSNDPIGYIGYCGIYAEDPNSGLPDRIAQPVRARLYTDFRGDFGSAYIQCQSAPCPMITEPNRYGIIKNIPASVA